MRTLPPEPKALRAELRALAGEVPDRAHRRIAAALGDYLCASWALEEPEPDLLALALDRARSEAWLWVMGDRRWAPLVESLEGRLCRLCDRLGRLADLHGRDGRKGGIEPS